MNREYKKVDLVYSIIFYSVWMVLLLLATIRFFAKGSAVPGVISLALLPVLCLSFVLFLLLYNKVTESNVVSTATYVLPEACLIVFLLTHALGIRYENVDPLPLFDYIAAGLMFVNMLLGWFVHAVSEKPEKQFFYHLIRWGAAIILAIASVKCTIQFFRDCSPAFAQGSVDALLVVGIVMYVHFTLGAFSYILLRVRNRD